MKIFRRLRSGLFEEDFYSSSQGLAYSVKSVRSELKLGYFSFWQRLLRNNLACVRMRQQEQYPVVMEVECVGVPKEHVPRAYGLYQGYFLDIPLREHYGDALAGELEYRASQRRIERLLGEDNALGHFNSD